MIRVNLKLPFKSLTFESGKLYYFSYRKFEQDPQPFVLFISHLRGTNPTTGNFWNFLQCINLHYLTKISRIRLIKASRYWSKSNKKIEFRSLYFIPGIEFAIRRYVPASSYINKVKEVDDGIVEVKKPVHAKRYLPKGVKYADLMARQMRPRSMRKKKKSRRRR